MSYSRNRYGTSRHGGWRSSKQRGSPIIYLSGNPQGTRIVNTRADGSIHISRLASSGLGDLAVIENAHEGVVQSISWLPKAETSFASAGGDGFVKIWRNETPDREIPMRNGTSRERRNAKLVSFSPDGAAMIVATHEGAILVFDPRDNYAFVTECNVAELHGDSETGVEITKERKYANVDSDHNTKSNLDIIADIKWTNRGHSCFLVGLSSGPVLIFNYASNVITVTHSLDGCRSVTCLLVDPRGRYIAAGSKEGVVSFWNTASMVNSRALTSIDQGVSSLAASPDGLYFIVGYDAESNSRIFKSDTLEEVREIPKSMAGSENQSIVAWDSSRDTVYYSHDHGSDLGAFRNGDHPTSERTSDRQSERASERTSDRRYDRTSNRQSERASERTSGRQYGRQGDRNSDNGRRRRRYRN